MSQPAVKWGQAERYFLRYQYTIVTRGGDKFVSAPRDGSRMRRTVRVGHTSCNHFGSQILPVYLSKFKNVFGISIDDILSE